MIYTEPRKMAVIAAYTGDLQKLDKKINELAIRAKTFNENARKIWSRALLNIQDRRKRFEDVLNFIEGFPIESFDKEVPNLTRKWGDLKHAYDRASASLAGQKPEVEDKNAKKHLHSWFNF